MSWADLAKSVMAEASPAGLLMLDRDENLLLLVAAWTSLRLPRAKLSPPPAKVKGIPELWDAYHLDRAALCGTIKKTLGGNYPASSVLEMAVNLGLVYPENVILDQARLIVAGERAKIVNKMNTLARATSGNP